MIDLNDVLLAMSNIPVDDPIAEIWGRELQGGYKIIKYTDSLPITISANGDALIDYRIYGASGGVGEPTDSGEPAGYKLPMTVQSANLFDKNAPRASNQYLNSDGGLQPASSNISTTDFVKIDSSTVYTITATGSVRAKEFDDAQNPIRTNTYNDFNINANSGGTFTTSANAAYLRFSVQPTYIDALMLTSGSTAPTSYIPYYRTDVPVYIGENRLDSVEGVADYVDKASGKIVRMIGEYTFTGDESFNKFGNSDVFYTSTTIDPVGITTVNTITMRCNHPAFTAIENKDTRYWLNPEADDICCFLPGGMSQVFLRSTSNFTTTAECKAYLKAQYDNGTPVKISYWLKTPVEEDPPVSFPDTPTIKGETIIDYDGEPKPSQMYVKYKGKAVQ